MTYFICKNFFLVFNKTGYESLHACIMSLSFIFVYWSLICKLTCAVFIISALLVMYISKGKTFFFIYD